MKSLIKNDLELEITNERLSEFLQAANNFDMDEGLQKLTYKKQQILRNAVLGEVEVLREQVNEYNALKSGKVTDWDFRDLINLPTTLIQYRIAKGMSQSELARKVSISETALEDMEDNLFADTDGEMINRIMAALGINVPATVTHMFQQKIDDIVNNARKSIGFIWERIVPRDILYNDNSTDGYVKLYTAINRVFGDQLDNIIMGKRLDYQPSIAVRYKVPQGATSEKVYEYTSYASHIARIVSGMSKVVGRDLTTDPHQFKQNVMREYGNFTLEACVNYMWDLGISVMPLQMNGGFHGACWRFDGKNVIVLKQRSKFGSRWLFDLLHEYWHATQEPGLPERTVVDITDVLSGSFVDREEDDANEFANNVIFDGKAQELLRKCYEQANSKIDRFKRAVEIVARNNNVDVGSLANLVAYDLVAKGRNWWGAANNLQGFGEPPYDIVRSIFEERFDLDEIDDELDREILQSAFNE